MSFQILRRFGWVFLVLMISPTINTFSQASTTPETTPEPLQEIIVLISGDVQPSEEFLQAFERWTAVNGHTVRILTEAEAVLDPAARPLLRLKFEQERQDVELQLLVHPLRKLSTLLVDLPSPAIVPGSTPERVPGLPHFKAIDVQTITVAAYALNAVGDCSGAHRLAMVLFPDFSQDQPTKNVAPQIFDPNKDLLGFRGLLELNCILLNENFEINQFLHINPTVWQRSSELDIAGTTNSAWAYLQSGDNETAFAKLDDLAERWSDDTDATIEILRKRSQFYGLINDFDSAMESVLEAISLAEADEDFPVERLAGLYIQRGQVHTLLYEWDNAIGDYTTAINLAPDNEAVAEAYYYRGFIYYTTLFDRERALPDFERYLELASYGDHRENAMQYRADIQAELEALSG
jgi:tetratricopeptide (TPR) repeat protein